MKPVRHRSWRGGFFFAGALAIAVTGAWHAGGATLVQPSRPLDGRLQPLDWRRTALVVRKANVDDSVAEAQNARKTEKRKRVEETKYRYKKKTGFSAFTLEELHRFLEALQINTRRVDMSDKRAVIKKLLKVGAQPGDFADISATRSRHSKAASGSQRAQASRGQNDSPEADPGAFRADPGAFRGEPIFFGTAEDAAEATMARALKDGWRPQDLTVKAAQVLLGLPNPSPQDVRAAKKRLALKWHPDLNTEHPKAADAFALIIKAADLLQ